MMNEDVNLTPTYFEHCEVISNQFILQAHNINVEQSCNLNTVEIESPGIFCKMMSLCWVQVSGPCIYLPFNYHLY